MRESEKGRGLNKFLLAWAAADERMIGAAGIQGGGRSEQDGIHSTQGWARGSLLHHQGLCVLEREGERERRERLGVGRPLVRYHPIVQSNCPILVTCSHDHLSNRGWVERACEAKASKGPRPSVCASQLDAH
jgi:hypothetical protein